MEVSSELQHFFATGEITNVTQSNTQTKDISDQGIVQTIIQVSPGSGYPDNTIVDGVAVPLEVTGGTGTGLTITTDPERTGTSGIVGASFTDPGLGYTVGDQVTLVGGDNNCVYEVSEIVQTAPLYTSQDFSAQNNYLILPDSVVGVNRILRSNNHLAWGFGGFGVPMQSAMMVGGMYGMGGLGGTNFDLTSYYTMQQFLATADWMLFPQISYNFNIRTHRLHIESDNFSGVKTGQCLVLECDTKADPDLYPDVWNDMFLKKLSTAYVQLAWGRILTKYQQVQLPGGITMNGDQIYNDAKQEIAETTERFSMDFAMPPLDYVG